MIKEIKGKKLEISESCFIAETASVVGEITIGEESSVWYGAVIRSDMNKTIIGSRTNIQENTTVHNDKDYPTLIGDGVTIGHNCIIHGCTIKNNSLIGMGSIILNGSIIGENTIIGAGSLITQNKEIPSGVLVLGSPAKVIRNLTEEEILSLKESAKHYVEMANMHK